MSEPTILFRAAQPGIDPEVELRAWPPDETAGDLGIMYVLEALGVSIIVRDRADGLYVHLCTVDAETPRRQPHLPLVVEVNNGGENQYGEATGSEYRCLGCRHIIVSDEFLNNESPECPKCGSDMQPTLIP